MDHYTVLGLSRNASKEEIKEAFRKLAMQFHPDKHSHSPKFVRDGATLRFKQVSEAYGVLMDDSKRAQYNLRYGNNGNRYSGGNYYHNAGRTGSYGFNSSSTGFGYAYSSFANGNRFMSNLEVFLQYLTTREFLRNLTFAGALIGVAVILDISGEALWKRHNAGHIALEKDNLLVGHSCSVNLFPPFKLTLLYWMSRNRLKMPWIP